MATDHSDIQQFPATRWVELQATGTDVEVVTLPTTLTALRISILNSLQSDKSTTNAYQVSFDQSLSDGDAMPAIAEGVDRIEVAAGIRLEDITVPANEALAITQMAISGANSGWVQVSYDAVPGEDAGI